MKQAILAAFIALLAVSLAAAVPPDTEDRDIRVIRKAVKEDPASGPGQEAKWFKLLVVDAKSHKDKVKITLPISVVEALVNCSRDHRLRLRDEDCEVDLKTLLKDLKKAGPLAIIEVCEDGEVIKVWLE